MYCFLPNLDFAYVPTLFESKRLDNQDLDSNRSHRPPMMALITNKWTQYTFRTAPLRRSFSIDYNGKMRTETMANTNIQV